MTRAPEPRPALKRSADGGLHPAAPQAAPPHHLHPAPHAPTVPPATAPGPAAAPVAAPQRFKPGDLRARKAAAGGKAGKTPKPENLVNLDVKVPKKLRKAVRRKAEVEGWPVDDAVAYVLRAWVES